MNTPSDVSGIEARSVRRRTVRARQLPYRPPIDPVLVASGVHPGSVRETLAAADGAIATHDGAG